MSTPDKRTLRPERRELLPGRHLSDLLAAIPGARLAGAQGAAPDSGPDPVLGGITQDSTAVQPGDLYLARAGGRSHGAEFAAAAAAAGAVAVLTDPDGVRRAGALPVPVVVVPDARAAAGAAAALVYGEPARDLLLLGVTGTNGKTTTAYLLEAGLAATGARTGLIGTVETRIAGTSVASVHTTPEATDLQALFAVMRERGVTAAAMEVSSHALALHRVDGTRFRVAAFTNLSQDHLDFHADLEDYFAAKARLFTPALADVGVVNVDDPYGARLARTAPIPVITCSAGGNAAADWRAVDVVADATGSTFRVVGAGQATTSTTVRAPLPGAFNVANTLIALATLAAAEVPLDVAATGIGRLPGVPGRLQRVDAGQPFTALVDFAHTPDAVSTVLAAVRPVTSGRLLVVLGCGGDRDRAKRPLMGAAAVRGADLAVLTSDNPRSEDPAAILDATAAGALAVPQAERGELHVEPDRRAAIRYAVQAAQAGDTVVVAGKGHEQGQEIAGVVRPFDDRAVLAEEIRRMWGES